MMNDYAFGNFLYTLRTEKGLSQSQLGDLLGVTNKAVSKWENGYAKPNTNLLPKLADILSVRVEELFAGKRIDEISELSKIAAFLSVQKKKYAVLTSAFLASLVTLPLLMIEFVCVIMGFHIPDDIIGPLSAIGSIVAFVASLVSFFIFRNIYKHTPSPTESTYTPRFVTKLRTATRVTALVWAGLFITVLSMLLIITHTSFTVNVIYAVLIFLWIASCALLIYLTYLKRLLRIHYAKISQQKGRQIPFSELPLWGKVCYITVILLSPLIICLRISGIEISILISVWLVWFFCMAAVLIYRYKHR